VPHHQRGQNHNLLIVNKSFEYVAHFKHLETTVTKENRVYEEIMSKLNLGNAYYRSTQSPLQNRKD
jgi:hypothetical protein